MPPRITIKLTALEAHMVSEALFNGLAEGSNGPLGDEASSRVIDKIKYAQQQKEDRKNDARQLH